MDERAQSILPLADFYLLTKLKSLCVAALKRNIDPSNVTKMLLLAHRYSCPDLKIHCFDALRNMSERKRLKFFREEADEDLFKNYLDYIKDLSSGDSDDSEKDQGSSSKRKRRRVTFEQSDDEIDAFGLEMGLRESLASSVRPSSSSSQ